MTSLDVITTYQVSFSEDQLTLLTLSLSTRFILFFADTRSDNLLKRLKGLTTGGLPTFIDFRDNFHSPEIAEDNWVAQIKSRAERRARKHGGSSNKSGGRDGGGELVFMGDDTWVSLYPTYFSRSFPFPSFNTR